VNPSTSQPASGPPPHLRADPAVAGDRADRAAANVSEAVRAFRLKITRGLPLASVRRAVRTVLTEWGVSEGTDDALLVATELVQNVTQHTAGPGELRLALPQGVILIEVSDTDVQPPVQRAYDPHRLGGRGLVIVAAVARRWGYRPTSDAKRPGKVVWAEIAPTTVTGV
jgi:hypothetical protein